MNLLTYSLVSSSDSNIAVLLLYGIFYALWIGLWGIYKATRMSCRVNVCIAIKLLLENETDFTVRQLCVVQIESTSVFADTASCQTTVLTFRPFSHAK